MRKINMKHDGLMRETMSFPIVDITDGNFEDYRSVMVSVGHEPFKTMTYSEVANLVIPGTLTGALVDDKIVGVCGAYSPPKYVVEASAAGLYGLSVLPEYRNRGIGSFLINMIIHKATAYGYMNMYVAVHESRRAAIRLYRKMGFMELPENVKRYEIINWLIQKYDYKRYLEIGVRRPEKCFDKVVCKKKVGVDPAPKGKCKHVMTSDDFFKINEDMYDIVFVDGLHLEHQAKKDIENSLAVLKPNGTIVIHDCNPPTEWHQREIIGDEDKWNGTVWKAYMHYRSKDYLKMCIINEDWGIGIIRRGKQEPVFTGELSYSGLDANRGSWLNLMSFHQFKEWID